MMVELKQNELCRDALCFGWSFGNYAVAGTGGDQQRAWDRASGWMMGLAQGLEMMGELGAADLVKRTLVLALSSTDSGPFAGLDWLRQMSKSG